MFLSSFNCLYQRDHNDIPAAETIPRKCIKYCDIVQKYPQIVQVAVVPYIASISFISLWRDSKEIPYKHLVSPTPNKRIWGIQDGEKSWNFYKTASSLCSMQEKIIKVQ